MHDVYEWWIEKFENMQMYVKYLGGVWMYMIVMKLHYMMCMKARVVMFTRMNCKLYEDDRNCANIYVYVI